MSLPSPIAPRIKDELFSKIVAALQTTRDKRYWSNEIVLVRCTFLMEVDASYQQCRAASAVGVTILIGWSCGRNFDPALALRLDQN